MVAGVSKLQMTITPFWRWLPLFLLWMVTSPVTKAQTVIVVGGNYTTNIIQALNGLDLGYVDASNTMNPDPAAYDLSAGDVIIISNDGGSGPFVDYTDFMESGGHLIVMGGSSDQNYRDWAALYFTLTDTDNSWHTDGAWVTTEVNHPAAQGLPVTYTFENNSATYHMLAFLPAADTVLYGRNTEPNFIAAFRTYPGGGSINYMALDIGNQSYTTTTDNNTFVFPWISSAMQTAAAIPEPSTWALIGTGIVAVAWQSRRRWI